MEEKPKKRILLGIDPGTNFMGYGVIAILKSEPCLMGYGVLDMKKGKDPYRKLKEIYEFTTQVIEKFKPTEFAIESQFYGENVQSMLKLGRAQGVSIAAALEKNLPIAEYAPLKIKQAVTGNGRASKEQIARMLQQYLHIPEEKMPEHLDATDAIGVALCHYFQSGKATTDRKYTGWGDYVSKNKNKVKE